MTKPTKPENEKEAARRIAKAKRQEDDADHLDPEVLWQKMSVLALLFCSSGERERSRDLESVGTILVAISAGYRPTTGAMNYLANKTGNPKFDKGRQEEILLGWIDDAVGRDETPRQIAERIVSFIHILPELYVRAVTAPIFGTARWEKDYPVAVDRVAARLAKRGLSADSKRLAKDAMEELGYTESAANHMFRERGF